MTHASDVSRVLAGFVAELATPKPLVHYYRGWLQGGISFTGCGLKLMHGVTVAGTLGTSVETTCPACLESLQTRGWR